LTYELRHLTLDLLNLLIRKWLMTKISKPIDRRTLLTGSIGLFILPTLAQAQTVAVPGFVLAKMPTAKPVGQARFTAFGLSIFDAVLFAPNGKYDSRSEFALRLTYQRAFTGLSIAEHSIKEIRKQGFKDEAKLRVWMREMTAIFPNVSKGSSITGFQEASGITSFFFNGKPIGTITDKAFAGAFFGIWLNPKTSPATFRNRLLGVA
jgi:Chalcone isomerase-like